MKKPNSIWIFTCGALLGVCLMLCLGAAEKEVAPVKKEPAPVQIVTYASGVTGFFDPNSRKLYLYDVDLKNCYLTLQFNSLGAPTSRP